MNCPHVPRAALLLGLLALALPTLLAQNQGASRRRPFGGGGGASAATDPGPRGGPAGAGGPYSTSSTPALSPADLAAFTTAMQVFMETDSVSGTIANETGSGLGPTFNANSCAGCHAEPAVGGSSPGLNSPQKPVSNPQVGLATLDGATNTVPSFITPDGPVREARFVRNPDGTADGGVHDLFTVTGRSDATGCTLAQPNFAQAVANHNVIYRIPTPTFGLGLVEATPDATLLANLNDPVNQAAKAALGIRGSFNTSGNDGTITRFGWKAQNKSLLIFAGEAYNVEMGVDNEAFPNPRSAVPGCVFGGSLKDATTLGPTSTTSTTPRSESPFSDIQNFVIFMRFLAPPAPANLTDPVQVASANNGSTVFNNIGCSLCHTSTLTTGPVQYSALSNVTYSPFSDFALHRMGWALADGVRQGNAGGEQFRTAPLWGVGQRLFLLHDGRTTDLVQAIRAHASNGSEANAVVNKFNALSQSDAQDLLNFLRSL